MGFLRFVFSRSFVKNLAIAIGLTLVLIFVVLKIIDIYTNHGNEFAMPDLTGSIPEELHEQYQDINFEYIVIDSIFIDEVRGGSVAMQDPLPGSMVKKNRKIYLTLVAMSPETVEMPDLRDLTLRQAIAIMETYGLSVDSLEYIPDIARNAVLEQWFDGIKIEPGESLEKGSGITLVLGMGLGRERINVPFLIGKSKDEAYKILRTSSLNVGAEFYEGATDSVNVVVSRQSPVFSLKTLLNLGTPIDLWYIDSSGFNMDDFIRDSGLDSLIIDSLLYDSTDFDSIKNEDLF